PAAVPTRPLRNARRDTWSPRRQRGNMGDSSKENPGGATPGLGRLMVEAELAASEQHPDGVGGRALVRQELAELLPLRVRGPAVERRQVEPLDADFQRLLGVADELGQAALARRDHLAQGA